MADKCVIMVDNSNIFIEGQKYSAQYKGQDDDKDRSWRIDFGRLLEQLAAGREIHTAILVGSRPPKNDSVWEEAKRNGFSVTVHDRDAKGKEKAVDTELVAQATRIISKAGVPMVLVVASGDRDFIPLVNVAHEEGWSVEMAAFSSAFSAMGQMATTVDKIVTLDAIFTDIGYNASECIVDPSVKT